MRVRPDALHDLPSAHLRATPTGTDRAWQHELPGEGPQAPLGDRQQSECCLPPTRRPSRYHFVMQRRPRSSRPRASTATAITACWHPIHPYAQVVALARQPPPPPPQATASPALPRATPDQVRDRLCGPCSWRASSKSCPCAAACAGVRCASSLSSPTLAPCDPSSATGASPLPLPERLRHAARHCGSRPPSSTGMTPQHPRPSTSSTSACAGRAPAPSSVFVAGPHPWG